MNRSKGELLRLDHALQRLRSTVENVALAAAVPGPIGHDAAQALQQTANEVAAIIARHDAFELAERDSRDAEQDAKLERSLRR